MSSVSNKYISNKEAVPIIDGDVFSNHEDKRFALGVFSSEDVLSYRPDSILQAYLKLRANVYVDQTGMLEKGVKRSDGTELDENDERSTHFVIFENVMGRVAVFACMRAIEKTADKNLILPIEEFFPEAFAVPSPDKSVEVSRFIVRHDEAKSALFARMRLMTSGLAYALKNDLGPIYGVVEPEFEKLLKHTGISLRRIAEPKLVNEYNDNNLGFEIDREKCKQRIGEAILNNMVVPVGSFSYWGDISKNKLEKK